MASRIREFARDNRKHPTDAEMLLWEVVRNRRLGGLKFLRQHPLAHTAVDRRKMFYIADFYCAIARVVIELDGDYHIMRVEEDSARDQLLAEQDIITIRFRNEELEDMPPVKDAILAACLGRSVPSHPRPPSAADPSLLRKEG